VRAKGYSESMDEPAARAKRIREAIDQYQGRLIAFAARITGDWESARDVVQETFLRLCREDLDALADHLPAWLFRVCRNRALDVRKKEAPLEPFDESRQLTADGAGDPLQRLEQSDAARSAMAAVAKLPAAQQEVLRLRFQEELSYKEISAITRLSVSNVGVLIHTGIRRIRQRMRVPGSTTRPHPEGGRSDA
jgi:RNA polymerase sigma factor (sigma-70 family)